VTWKDLNNEGVRLVGEGDTEGAETVLRQAYQAADGSAERASTLVNLAAAVHPDEALDLLDQAAGLADDAALRATVLAARANTLLGLGRWDEAWADTERGLVDAAPREQAMLRTVRTGLLIAVGRLEEAGTETLTATDLHPEFAEEARASLEFIAATPACVVLNARGAALAQAGDHAGACSAFEAAYQAALGSDEVEALVCRAAIAGNLAGLVEAVRWSTEAIETARSVLAAVGDSHGTSTVLVNALLVRAQHLGHASRAAEALADLDEAARYADTVALRSVRARVLAAAGRFGEAAAEATAALDLAYTAEPHLAASLHTTLAEIAGSTGDLAGSAEHHALARDLSAATGDRATEAGAVLSLARLAYLGSDNDRAEALYAEAEGLLHDDPHRLAVSLHGRAAVAIGRGRPEDALRLLDRVQDRLATPVEVIALHQVRGGALEALGDHAEADEEYAAAEAVSTQAGLRHVALGIAWWRADALMRSTTAPDPDLGRRALDLALPAALAAEAVRHRFAHGPLRERWIALAAAPATRAAFAAIGMLGDVHLAAAYIDHLTATVTLHTDAAQVSAHQGHLTDAERTSVHAELLSFPEPPADHLPYAASFLTVASTGLTADFPLPPRVRVDPTKPSTLDSWIDVAEQRYGFPVRSVEAVASW
jgi:tetratricopeptide (TPR) repeat protein